MIEKLKALYQRHGDILRYAIIGGLTTLVDLVIFTVSHSVFGLHYQLAKVLAWIFAVTVSFWGNKVVVFRATASDGKSLLKEAGSFVATRLATLAFSIVFLYVTVELFGWNESLSNLISNLGVVVFNYILGKIVVFRKPS